MDDEKMKEAWRMNACRSCDNLMKTAMSKDIIEFRHKTALTRLSDRYRRFFTVGFIMVPASVAWAMNPIFDGPMRMPVIFFLVFYFLLCGFMDLALYRKINAIDVLEMTTGEVIERAKSCKRLHFRFIMILLPLAVLFVTVLVTYFIDDRYIIIGICTGGTIGLLIGSKFLMNFIDDYKNIS